jgi:hypothetical protein
MKPFTAGRKLVESTATVPMFFDILLKVFCQRGKIFAQCACPGRRRYDVM